MARQYVELLKQALTGGLHHHSFVLERKVEQRFGAELAKRLHGEGIELVRAVGGEDRRLLVEEGRGGWPLVGETMIGLRRLENVQRCVEGALADAVAGDLIEAGVWRGGAAIFMRGLLWAHGVSDRDVWLADSFAGLPEPDPERYPADSGDRHHTQPALRVDVDQVRASFRRYGLLDEQVRFVEGWFRDTLPGLADRRWAVVRLDGDMYESTMDGLRHLYPGLSPGGYLIVDDYGAIPGARQAVDDFRQEYAITAPIEWVDWTGIWWRKLG